MALPSELYRPSLGLLTDFYQLTMAYAAWKEGLADQEAVFHLHFRKHPFKGGFTVAAGMAPALDLLTQLRFSEEDLAFLGGITDSGGGRMFERGFLEYLKGLEVRCDVDGVPEGTVVFPQEPLLRVQGPIIPCMLLETPLLNVVNFQTLIASKAARICLATGGEPVLEFGLRRAQGIDGALSASRAAYLGGVAATSNTLAGRLYGIPVRGTHAHSWVMLFDDELSAFESYADALPSNCVFLVDTYDSLEGVNHAIQVGRTLREHGRELVGIRLDSGDLAYLSIEARKRLDAAGFEKAAILATNDLDEHIISSLKEQGARVNVWGVGTRLATAFEEPALGGVYKLSAVREPRGPWKYRIKLSEQAGKVSTPGILQVRRYEDAEGQFVADMIYDETRTAAAPATIVDPFDLTRRRVLRPELAGHDLLVPMVRSGKVLPLPTLEESRRHAQTQLGRFHAGVKRFVHPHQFPVGLELSLFEFKTRLILEARGHAA